MLSIRMQRLGRKGYPVYRVVVQDSRQAPNSGKYVAMLGSYDPHSKTANIVKDKAEFYLKNGAQPSDRVVKLFADEKIKLPDWVKQPTKQKRDIKNPDKLRKNRPAEEVQATEETEVNEETTAEETTESSEQASEATESTADETKEAEKTEE